MTHFLELARVITEDGGCARVQIDNPAFTEIVNVENIGNRAGNLRDKVLVLSSQRISRFFGIRYVDRRMGQQLLHLTKNPFAGSYVVSSLAVNGRLESVAQLEEV